MEASAGTRASIMIGEKAAEMVAVDHGVELTEFVREHPASARLIPCR